MIMVGYDNDILVIYSKNLIIVLIKFVGYDNDMIMDMI